MRFPWFSTLFCLFSVASSVTCWSQDRAKFIDERKSEKFSHDDKSKTVCLVTRKFLKFLNPLSYLWHQRMDGSVITATPPRTVNTKIYWHLNPQKFESLHNFRRITNKLWHYRTWMSEDINSIVQCYTIKFGWKSSRLLFFATFRVPRRWKFKACVCVFGFRHITNLPNLEVKALKPDFSTQ